MWEQGCVKPRGRKVAKVLFAPSVSEADQSRCNISRLPLPMSMTSLPRRKCNNNNLWKCINTNVWQNSKSEPNRIRNFCRYLICLVYYPRPSQKTESKMFPDTNFFQTNQKHFPTIYHIVHFKQTFSTGSEWVCHTNSYFKRCTF